MKIKEIMNKVFVVDSDITLKKAAEIMSKKRIGCLVLIGKKLGLVTERDVVKNIKKLNKKISSVMSQKLISVSPEDSLEKAALIMSENKIRRLLVTDKSKERLLGIITATDIIANSDLLNQFF